MTATNNITIREALSYEVERGSVGKVVGITVLAAILFSAMVSFHLLATTGKSWFFTHKVAFAFDGIVTLLALISIGIIIHRGKKGVALLRKQQYQMMREEQKLHDHMDNLDEQVVELYHSLEHQREEIETTSDRLSEQIERLQGKIAAYDKIVADQEAALKGMDKNFERELPQLLIARMGKENTRSGNPERKQLCSALKEFRDETDPLTKEILRCQKENAQDVENMEEEKGIKLAKIQEKRREKIEEKRTELRRRNDLLIGEEGRITFQLWKEHKRAKIEASGRIKEWSKKSAALTTQVAALEASARLNREKLEKLNRLEHLYRHKPTDINDYFEKENIGSMDRDDFFAHL